MKKYDSAGVPIVSQLGGGAGGGVAISGAGASASAGTVVFSNSNNVSFGMAGSTITATATVSQTVQTQGIHSYGVSTGGNTAGNTATVTGRMIFVGGNNITLSQDTAVNGSITINISGPNTVAQSNQSVGFYGVGNTTQNSSTTLDARTVSFGGRGIVTVGYSNGTIQISATEVPQTVQTQGIHTYGVSNIGNTAGNTGTVTGRMIFSGNNNITLSQDTGVNGSITIGISAANQSNQQISAYAQSNTTQSSSGTFNASSVQFAGAGIASVGVSNGSVVISVPAGGGAGDGGVFAGVSNLGNTAGSTGTVSTGDLVLVGSNGITLSQSTAAAGSHATITINGAPPLSSYEPYEARGASTGSAGIPTATSAAVNVYPIFIQQPVSAGAVNLAASMAFLTVGTSSGRQTAGMWFGLYSRGTGTNSTTIGTVTSTKWEWSITGNNSSYSISQATETAFTGYGFLNTNSAGSNITSGYTGMKLVQVPINALLTPGQYYFALMGTNSTSSVNVGISVSTQGFVVATRNTALAPMGSFSSAYSRAGNNLGGAWPFAAGSWTSAGSVTGLPVSMALTSISHGLTQIPLLSFWST